MVICKRSVQKLCPKYSIGSEVIPSADLQKGEEINSQDPCRRLYSGRNIFSEAEPSDRQQAGFYLLFYNTPVSVSSILFCLTMGWI